MVQNALLRRLMGCALAAWGVAPVDAQQPAPSSLQSALTELGHGTPTPFMGSGCRIQQFYESSELGNPEGRLTISAVSLRFDGPTGASPAVRHSIDLLTIRIGTTNRNIDEIGAVFADNLTLPLTTVFTAANYTFDSDAIVAGSPQAWGGPNGQLRFEFGAPVTVTIPDRGCFVLEIEAHGNSNNAVPNSAELDFYTEGSAVTVAGSSTRSGFGCGATLETTGQYEPGTAFFWDGANYPPNTPILNLATAELRPIILPGTTCWLYLDLATGGILELATSGPSGEVSGGVPLPRVPELCGAVIYLQNVGLTPRTPQSPPAVVTSNYRTVQVGCTQRPTTRGWFVENDGDPDADIARRSQAGGLALRIE